MYCKHCGNQIPDNSKFCAKCGHQLVPIAGPTNRNMQVKPPTPSQPIYQSPQPQSRIRTSPQSSNRGLKLIFFSLLAISILSLILTIVGLSRSSQVEDIMSEGPAVESEIYQEWGDRPFSIGEIGN